MVRLLLFLLLALPAAALTVEQAGTGSSADDTQCSLSKTGVSFPSTLDNVYFRFVVRGVRRGDQLTVQWVDPRGEVHSSAAYEDLPTAPSLCFLTALPMGGFPASQQPGQWTVRLMEGERIATSRGFVITGTAAANGLRIDNVTRRDIDGALTEVEIAGIGFVSESVVNIAQYKKEGGWDYIAVLLPQGTSGDKLTVRIPVLEPAEYLVIVGNPDGRQSPPARFLVSTPSGYKLPTPAGVPWVITQGPYGSFSHFGRSVHAWDIAPRSGACLVAMRAGIAHTFDLGLPQTPNRRIFGNYITVEHPDGEFSHYGHLKSGTFRIRNGQPVQQGQPLATAGNSGHTVGQGGGYHVHVHVTKGFNISSPSIPFRFTDLPGVPGRGVRSMVVSSNNSTVGDCDRSTSTSSNEVKGTVAVEGVWSHALPVAAATESLAVSLAGPEDPLALDLSLVSPAGRQYAVWAEGPGWEGGPLSFRIPQPEAGTWHLFVRGLRGNEPIPFRLNIAAIEQTPVQPPKKPAYRKPAAPAVSRSRTQGW